MAHAHVNAFFLQLLRSRTEVCLTVVVGEEHTRLDDAGCLLQLVGGHRIRLVAGQESNIDVFQRSHPGISSVSPAI